MRRSSTTTIGILILALVGLVGCDAFENGSSSVQDFDIQGNMLTPSGRTVTPELAPTFAVEYQGLSGSPTASTSSDILEINTISTEGEPQQGGLRTWRVNLTVDEIQETLAQETVVVEGNTADGRAIADTLSVSATTTLSVTRDFASSFFTIADYEGDVTDNFDGSAASSEEYDGSQREVSTSGETDFSIINDPSDGLPEGTNQPSGSNGVRFMEIEGSGSGSLTINRWVNLPDSDQMSFLIRPASSSFTLTVTLNERTSGGMESHELELPVPPGGDWIKIGVPFRFFDGFNPVAERSGGDGPLTSVQFSADANVTYAVDEIVFGEEGVGGRTELHDFEQSTSAYGGFTGGASFGFAPAPDSVSASSDGLTSRLLRGAGSWGYNYGGAFGPPALVFLDADLNDVFTFSAKGSTETSGSDEVTVSIAVPNGEGGFDSSVTRVLEDDTWQTFEIPLSEFGANPDPSALRDPGIRSFDFGFNGELLIDDIKIEPRQ